MPQRPLLYFVDPITRDLRSTPPTANGSALNSWEAERARFAERWNTWSPEERERRVEKAIEQRRSVDTEAVSMTTTSAYESYRDVAHFLTPDVVSQYLATHGWVLETRDDIREIWYLITTDNPTPDRPAARVMVPLATDYVDYTARFTDVLYALGCVYDWNAPRLAEQLLAAPGRLTTMLRSEET